MVVVQSQCYPRSMNCLEFLVFSITKPCVGFLFRLSSVSFSFLTGESFLPAQYRSCSDNEAEGHPQGRIQPVHEGSESHPDSGATPWH